MRRIPLGWKIAVVIAASVCAPFILRTQFRMAGVLGWSSLVYWTACIFIARQCGYEARPVLCVLSILACVIATHVAIAYSVGPFDARGMLGPIEGYAICSLMLLVPIGMLVFKTGDRRFLEDHRDYDLSRYCDCGYDLTGNQSGICPECGTPIQDDENKRG